MGGFYFYISGAGCEDVNLINLVGDGYFQLDFTKNSGNEAAS
jgi:hypothetical protein